MSRTTEDVIYWIVLTIWLLGFVRYSIEYVRMVKAYTALTKSLLPLEKRIMDLETLVLPDRDF